MEHLFRDLAATAPIPGLTITALVVILVNAFMKESDGLQFWLTLLGLAANLVLAATTLFLPGTAFNGMTVTGGYASLFTMLFLVAGLLTLLNARSHLLKIGAPRGEFFILLPLSIIGMIVFSTALDLILTFIGLEILSICLYVMAGYTRRRPASNEAALKYFLLGSFASGFFLYGIALVFGTTGSTNLTVVAERLDSLQYNVMFHLGLGLMLIGFAFKVGAAPFHVWVPDVYEGSPTVATGFMATGAKASAFAALTIVFTHALGTSHNQISLALAVLAVASMVIGNVLAIAQTNVKRMLAYSSIAHAGYLLIGITAGGIESIDAVIFYLVAYVVTNLGAFGVLALVENEHQEGTDLAALSGLGRRRPVLAMLFAVFLFSLIGLPPFAGFFGKYLIFIAAIKAGYTWLTIVGVVMSVISVYYYLRVLVVMYFNEATAGGELRATTADWLPLVVSAALVLLLGFVPSLILNLLTSLFLS